MAQFHSLSLFTVLTDKDGLGRCWEKEAPRFAQWNRIDKPALQVFDVRRGWCAAQEEISLALNWHKTTFWELQVYLFVLATIYGPTLRWITPIEQKVFSNSYRLKDHEFIISSLLDSNQICWISTFYHFFVPIVRYHCNSPRLETFKKRSDGCGSSQSRNVSQVRTLRLRLHGANWDQGWHWMGMLLDLECQQLPALTSAKSCAKIDGIVKLHDFFPCRIDIE